MIQNILICTTQVPFTTGGAELHVEGLRRALIEAGYRAEIVALPFKWYPPSEIMRGAMAWRMLDLSASNGRSIDLVIGMKFPAYLVAHQRKVLWILHQHRSAYNLWGTQFDDLSTYPDGVRIREWIQHCDQRFIPEARKVFANSNTVKDRLEHYNNIESQKRQELLIEAMRFVRTPVKAVFAGRSHDIKRYEALIKQHRVADRVTMRGFVSDEELVELYANALAVGYLPFDEDYGYVTLEGMLSAKPVVVTQDGGGAAELIEHLENGMVVAPDARAIAEALDELYENRGDAISMGKRGREKLLAMKLSWENVVAKIISAAE